MIEKILIKPTYSDPYQVIIGKNLVNELINFINQEKPDKIIFCLQKSIVNHSVTSKYIENIKNTFSDVHIFELPEGENAKNINTILNLIDYFYKIEVSKSSFVICIGGGAASDAVGFISSIYLRGIPLILIPTTLLSMVDSSIGGKNAINYRDVKNVIGTIYQPKLVICDIDYLNTLPFREYISGLAEVIKYGITMSKEIVNILLSSKNEVINKQENVLVKLIKLSVSCKGKIVEIDEREEKKIRQILNYGHTIGHAVESCYFPKYTHGEAISIGMIYESLINYKLGFSEINVFKTTFNLVKSYELPYKIPNLNTIDCIVNRIRYDKKRRGSKISIPVVKKISEFEIIDFNLDDYLKHVVEIVSIDLEKFIT